MASSKPVVGVRIDIETKSSTPVKLGSYKYAEDPDFEVLVLAYATIRRQRDGSYKPTKPVLLDLYNQSAVDKFAAMLLNPRFQKHAFNANFERVCLSRWLGMETGDYIDPRNWHCSAIKANTSGVFGSLDHVAKAMRSPINKDTQGKALIKMFSIPITARSKHTCGCEGFHDPATHPEEFAAFERYCVQDVVTEYVTTRSLPDMSDDVQRQYEMDQRINDRGFRHFSALAQAAVDAVTIEQARLKVELKNLTGLDNPNSIPQMKGWLDEQGYPMDSLDKAHRSQALADPLVPDVVAEALTMKGAASLSSVTKHKAALAARGSDGRVRGSLQFYGAHTGREAGRGIQPQNLPRYEASAADRKRLLHGLAGADAPLIAKGSVRASIVPARGHVFVVPDYNAIEARCLGWQAQEDWVEDEFITGPGKIYEATAAKMFDLDKNALIAALKSCGKCGKCNNCQVRGAGKVSELALGYAGGAGALVTMGAEDNGIDIGNYKEMHALWTAAGKPGKFFQWNADDHDYPELLRLRDLYREARPQTQRFWKLCAAAFDSASNGEGLAFGRDDLFVMRRDGKHNRLILPSGRSIWYRGAWSHRDPDRDRVELRTYWGKGSTGQVRTETHGGKLTENVTQGVARDVLFDLMLKIEASNMPARLVLHVHDEVVLETPVKDAEQVLADVLGLMSEPPDWAPGLAVKGEGAVMERYGK